MSVTTIKRWLSVLEAGRIIFLLPPHFNNLGKRITKMPKVYFLDTGLACHLSGVRDRVGSSGDSIFGSSGDSILNDR